MDTTPNPNYLGPNGWANPQTQSAPIGMPGDRWIWPYGGNDRDYIRSVLERRRRNRFREEEERRIENEEAEQIEWIKENHPAHWPTKFGQAEKFNMTKLIEHMKNAKEFYDEVKGLWDDAKDILDPTVLPMGFVNRTNINALVNATQHEVDLLAEEVAKRIQRSRIRGGTARRSEPMKVSFGKGIRRGRMRRVRFGIRKRRRNKKRRFI